MLKNYLIVAWRNLLRHKLYSAINVLGLAIGIAFCILSFLFVRHEWSFDRFHEHADRIFRVNSIAGREAVEGLRGKEFPSTQVAVGPTLVEEFPEVVQAVRLRTFDDIPYTIRNEERSLNAKVVCGDPGFFSMFSFPVVAGNLQGAFQDKYSVVVTREIARKLFGDQDPLGRRISLGQLGEFEDLTLTGVIDVPANSTLQFDLLVPLAYWSDYQNKSSKEGRWGTPEVETFARLAEGADPAVLGAKLPAFAAAHIGTGDYFKLQPFAEVRHNPQIKSQSWPVSDPTYSRILALIALAVLLIACINFTNLTMGLATTHFKEVGMRKVLGATRQQLARQFWGEALILSFLALCAGVALAELFLPIFSNLVNVKLSLEYGALWPVLLALTLVVGLLTGSYPALILSRFQPVEVMKGKLRLGGTSPFSRLLVVLQFAPSIALIVGALLMSRQLDFIMTKNLGFNPDQVVIIDTYLGTSQAENRRLRAVYQQLTEQRPEIISISASERGLGHSGGIGGRSASREGKPDLLCYCDVIDYDFLETLGIHLASGRGFSRAFPGDMDTAILINERMAEELGWDNPMDKVLVGGRAKTVIGVVRNLHFFSLRQEISPMFFELATERDAPRYIFVKIRPDNIPATLALLKETWQQVAPGLPFVYSFLDQDVERQYRADQRWRTIVSYAAALATVIACLGAFGLASLAVARRTKEIGIRKVLGASVPSIVGLLGKEFTCLVIAANLIAWPVAYFAMHRWLQDFAYRIDLGPGVFVLGGMLALGIAWLTVSYQTIRAARANPVEALRYE